MDMKGHILAALQKRLEGWEDLLDKMSEDQILTPLRPSEWSIKDEIAHLMAWQQLSIARVEAAIKGGEPVHPAWVGQDDPDAEDVDQVNERIHRLYQRKSWDEVRRDWKEGNRRFLDLSGQIPERDLLDSSKYPWLKGYPLALILIACYDHYQEHFEKLQSRLQK